MKIGMISFTRQGFALAKKIEEKLKSIHTVNVSWCSKENQGEEVLLKDWSREHFLEDDALIFVGAAGIAMLAPCFAKLSMLSFSGTFVFPSMRVRIRLCETSGSVYSIFKDAAAPNAAVTPGQL